MIEKEIYIFKMERRCKHNILGTLMWKGIRLVDVICYVEITSERRNLNCQRQTTIQPKC